MAKGIIVVETPDYCDLCPLGRIFGMGGGVECMVAPDGRRVAGYGFHLEKPDYPPISENSYVAGWNDCVDYLEGRNGE